MKKSSNTILWLELFTLALFASVCGCANSDATSVAESPVTEHGDSTIEIPFTLTKWNNISIEVTVNELYPLRLMFHTGAGSVVVTEEAAKKCATLSFGEGVPSKSWGGESTICFCEGNRLSIEDLVFDDVTIYQDVNSGRDTDGKFGPGLFEGKIVEIDYGKSRLLIHDALPKKVDQFEKFTFVDPHNSFYVDGEITIDEKVVKNRFLIHSGYCGVAMLDDQFVADNAALKSLPVLSESQVSDSFGNVLKTKKIELPSIQLGSIEFSNVPVSIFDGAIGRQKISLVGGDLLKRLDIILDAKNSSIYLRKNRLKNEEYFSG